MNDDDEWWWVEEWPSRVPEDEVNYDTTIVGEQFMLFAVEEE